MPNSQGNMHGVYERMGKNEEATFQLDRRVQLLEEDKKAVNNMAVNIALIAEENVRQNQRIENLICEQKEESQKVRQTLDNINSNITLQNSTLQNVQYEIKRQGERIDDVESVMDTENEKKEKRKEDRWKTARTFLLGILSALIVSGLAILFNLK